MVTSSLIIPIIIKGNDEENVRDGNPSFFFMVIIVTRSPVAVTIVEKLRFFFEKKAHFLDE